MALSWAVATVDVRTMRCRRMYCMYVLKEGVMASVYVHTSVPITSGLIPFCEACVGMSWRDQGRKGCQRPTALRLARFASIASLGRAVKTRPRPCL